MLTEVKNNLKVMFLQLKYNLMRCMTNNVSFMTSILFMIFNNASFIIQWVTIFAIRESIGSYSLNDVMLFWAISSGSFGLAHILFHGMSNIPEYIEEGKLDSYLVSPKNVLCYVLTSDTEPSAFGDLIYGYIALCIFNFSIKNLLLYTILIIIGSFITTSFVVILHSITFFAYKSSYLADALSNAYLNGCLYPDVIFKGAVKCVLFTIIPSGFASWIPVHLILNFSITNFIILIIYTILLIALAFTIFNIGLKKYSSSNLMGSK